MGKLIWSMWGRYMALTAAVFMIDGALWSFTFSWPTFQALKELTALYKPLSVPGLIGLFMGLFTLLVEKPVFQIPMMLKPLLYIATALFGGMQFSCVIAAEFYLFAALVYLRAIIAGESSLQEQSSDRRALQYANRTKV